MKKSGLSLLLFPFAVFSFLSGETADSIAETLASPFTFARVNVITGEYAEAATDLDTGGGHPLCLRRYYGSSEEEGVQPPRWLFNYPNIDHRGAEGDVKNLSTADFVYEADGKKRLSKVKFLDGAGAVRNWLAFSYAGSVVDVTSLFGHRVSYTFQEKGSDLLLSSVRYPDNREISYHYREKGEPSVREKRVNGQLVLQNLFYEEGRIRAQVAPVGLGGALEETQRFFYGEGVTEVRDSLGNKTVYRYGTQNHLLALEHYLKGGNLLYRVERYFWKEGRLVSKALEDATGTVHACWTWRYDDWGRITEEVIWGDLSGTASASIVLDKEGTPQKNGTEHYHKWHTYAPDDRGLLLVEGEDNGRVLRYYYKQGTELLETKLLENKGKVVQREWYFYDRAEQLVKVVVDDGSSVDYGNNKGVSRRQTMEQQLCPDLGLPVLVEKSVWDAQTGQTVVWQRVENHYTSQGHLSKQEVFDSCGEKVSFEEREVDVAGRPVRLRDSTGVTETFYDVLGNKICETLVTPEGKASSREFTHDSTGRLIFETVISQEGTVSTQRYRYDARGCQVASIDTYGNETTCSYDALGRALSVASPAVLSSDGAFVRPVEQFSYNLFDHQVSHTDAEGRETHTITNVRGDPVSVTHPDGTSEHFTYALDGTLSTQKDREGRTTRFVRDSLGRPEKQFVEDAAGILVNCFIYTYKGMQLVSVEDSHGSRTCYAYDPAGRQCKVEQFVRGECVGRTEFSYEQGERVHIKKEWFGLGEQQYTRTVTAKDDLGQVEEIRIEDSQGTVLQKKEVRLEEVELEHTEEELVMTEGGQFVRQQIVTNAEGVQSICTFDALGRLQEKEKRDSFGRPFFLQRYTYDLVGNKVRECTGVEGEEYSVVWEWSAGNRLERMVEAAGTLEARETRYQYDEKGRVCSVQKPSGIFLYYSYDAAGRLQRLFSSDSTVDYTYEYDVQGHLISAADAVQGGSIEREYDACHRVICERLPQGYSLQREYDWRGRKTKLCFDDRSSVAYQYDSLYLRSVERRTPEGMTQYHADYSYEESGTLRSQTLPFSCGTVFYERGDKGELRGITSPVWEERILEGGYDSKGNICNTLCIDVAGQGSGGFSYDEANQLVSEEGVFAESYAYDSLGNRTRKGDLDSSYSADQLLLSEGECSYRYDPNGNPVEKSVGGKTTYYSYDALNRLVSLETQSERASYTYDIFNRRLRKQLYARETVSEQWKQKQDIAYLYDGEQEIAAFEHGVRTQLRVLGNGLGAPACVALELGGSTYVSINDHRGAVRTLLDGNTQQVVECYRYSAYGEEQVYNALGERIAESFTGNPWRYSGKRVDEESGLVYFGQRYYAPSSGRFLTRDPLGTPEGMNRFAYCLNNPLNRLDIDGCFSFSSLWNSFVETVGYCVRYVFSALFDFAYTIKRHYSYFTFMEKDIEKWGTLFLGEAFFYLGGHYNDRATVGVYGNGEVGDKVRVTLINGILTRRSDLFMALEWFYQTHGEENIHYVYRPTEGFTKDLFKSLMVKFGFVSPEAFRLADLWRRMIKEMGGVEGGGVIIHYAHSIGGADTYNARQMLTEEERKMLSIITLGSASLIPDDGLGSAKNYVSRRDGVPFMDPFGYLSALIFSDTNVVFVGSYWGLPVIDHILEMETYQQLVYSLGEVFVDQFGTQVVA